MRATRIVAIGFALGSLEHATGLLLMGFGVDIYANYPWWRHAAFAIVDAFVAWVAARRPGRLFIPVAACFIEQVADHGPKTWREWQTTGHVPWLVIVVHVFLFAAVVVAFLARSQGSRRETLLAASE